MAGLLNLVPRYLPRYGMAPRWAGCRPAAGARASPAIVVPDHLVFDADVDAQGGAYATGVLVLITSRRGRGDPGGPPAGQRGPRQSSSRGHRSRLRLHDGRQRRRATGRHQDRGVLHRGDRPGLGGLAHRPRPSSSGRPTPSSTRRAEVFVRDCSRRTIRLVAHEPRHGSVEEYAREGPTSSSATTTCRPTPDVIFVEVVGHRPHATSRATSPSVAWSATAGTGSWRSSPRRCPTRSRRSPCTCVTSPASPRTSTSSGPRATRRGHLLRFLMSGEGEVAPVTREVLRRAEPDPTRRPRVHVG